MESIIHNGTIALTSLALDAATMRHQAIAQNIANLNTPGYRTVEVSFEAQVQALLDGGSEVSLERLSGLRPVIQSAHQELSVDTQMAGLSVNTLHHQALLKALNKQFALLEAAINEGKHQ